MARLSLYLLGPYQVILNGKPVTEFRSDKARALLAYLALEADRPHRRDALAGLLWPDVPDRTARNDLRLSLHRLRRAIRDAETESPCLLLTRETVQFNPTADVWLDLATFTHLFVACEEHDHRRLATCAVCLERLREAAELYRGDVLQGFHVDNSLIFSEWALVKREALHRQALEAMYHLAEYHRQRGEYERALNYASRQLELEPWREEAHQQLMLALALGGQRSAALVQYVACRKILAEELGVEPAPETTALYEKIRAGELAGTPAEVEISSVVPQRTAPLPPCPYRGLFAFREEDVSLFFGREAFTDRLVEAVHQRAIIAVIGPSGSGKSSVVFAGLLPRLRQEETLQQANRQTWLIADFRPGSRPFDTLAAALIPLLESQRGETDRSIETTNLAEALGQEYLALSNIVDRILQQGPVADRLLLVVDQFEELYTLCSQPDVRRRFLDTLLEAVQQTDVRANAASFTLVLTLRADFMGQALAQRPFADVLQDASLILGPMNREELGRAIDNPARRQGVVVEAGLVERILADVGDEPGNLPLIQFALTSLWERQATGNVLTHTAYEAIGRVKGALTRYADQVYAGLGQAEQEQARRVLVQMVHPGEGTEDIRRLASRAELGENDWTLIKRLADARLVVTGRDPAGRETVEIVHEALIRSWRQLRAWINEDRAFRAWQDRLRVALHQWEASRHDEDALLRGALLSEAEGWLADRRTDLSQTEQAFIQASVALREQRQAERERERIARERLRQKIISGLVVGLVMAVTLALFAVSQWWQANEQRRIALSNQLAAQALTHLDNQEFDLALLLSLEAYRVANTLEARSSLLTGLQRSPYRAILRRHTDLVSSVAVSPDGRTLASGSVDGTIVLWDIATGQSIGQPLTHQSVGINTVAFSPNGQTLASANADGTIMIWDVITGQPIGSPFTGHTDSVESIAFSPDGQTLASGSGDRTIILWDVMTGRPITAPLTGHTGNVKSVAFSPDGHTLASSSVAEAWGGIDNTTILWDLATGRLKSRPLIGHAANVSSIAFSPDGRALASGSVDGTIVLWDVSTRQPKGELLSRTNERQSVSIVPENVKVAFSPDGRTLASASADGTIILWDVSVGQPRGKPLTGHHGEVNSLAFSPDGHTLVSGGSDNTVILWTIDQPLGQSFVDHSDRVWSIAFSLDGHILASGHDDGTITLWNRVSNQPIGQPLTGHVAGVNSLTFSPDGRTLASGSDDRTIMLWNVATGQRIGEPLIGHADAVNGVAFSPDGRMLASGSRDHTIVLWDAATHQPLSPPLTGHTDGVWSVAFHPNGQMLASGSWDHTIILWDVASRQPLRPPLTGHTAAVVSVAFSPNGERLASSSRDHTIILWDTVSGQPFGQPLVGHADVVWSVAFNPDGDVLTSGSCGQLSIYEGCNRGEIRLWDVATGRTIGQPFVGHTDVVWSVAFSPDGQTLASGSDDSMIILWDFSLESWQARACSIANRNLTRSEWQQYLGNEPYHETCSGL